MNRQFRSISFLFFYYVASLLLMLVIHYIVLSNDRLEQSKQFTQDIFYDIEHEEKSHSSDNLNLADIITRHPILIDRSYQLLLINTDGVTEIAENRLDGDEALIFNLPAVIHENNNQSVNYNIHKDYLQGWIKLQDGYEMSVVIYHKQPSFKADSSLWIPYLLVALMIILSVFNFINRMKLWNTTIDYANSLARPNAKSHKYNTYKPLEFDDPIIAQEFSRLGHAMSRANYQLHYRQRQLDTLVNRLERLVDHAPLPVAFIQKNGKLNFINDRFSYLFMVSLNNTILKITDVVMGADKHAQAVLETLDTQKIIQSIDVKHLNNNKTYQLHLMPWFSTHGQVQGFTIMLNDISYMNDELASTFTQINQQAARLSDYDRLWSVIGHELRTPLSGIIGMLELLTSGNLNQEQKETFETLEQTSQTMLYMLNDMLDLAKMEVGKLQINLEKTDIVQLSTQVCDLMVSNARRQGIELILYIDPQITGHVITDEARLRQVLLNLIGNAIKFTKSGFVALKVTNIHNTQDTDIIEDKENNIENAQTNLNDRSQPTAGIKTISANPINPKSNTDTGFQLCFEIIDTGIGISKEEQGKLFSYFNQANNNISKKFGGTGLGLAISKNFVNMLNGKIKLDSEVSKGSKFTVTLPINEHKISPIYQYHTDFSNICFVAITRHEITNQHLTKLTKHIELPAVIKTELTQQHIQDINHFIQQYQSDNKTNSEQHSTILLIDHDITLNSDMNLLNNLIDFDSFTTILWSMTPERMLNHKFLEKFDSYLAKPLDVSYFASEIMRLSQRTEDGEVLRVSKLQHTFNQFLDELETTNIKNKNEENKSKDSRLDTIKNKDDLMNINSIENSLSSTTSTKIIEETPAVESNTSPISNSSSLILVAEDNPVNLKVATKILEKLGYQYITAVNGKEVLTLLASRRSEINLILMDCRMPVMDGLKATTEIRKNEDSIPIIALTANDTDEDRLLCLRIGMDDFLAKPIKKDILKSMLSKYLV